MYLRQNRISMKTKKLNWTSSKNVAFTLGGSRLAYQPVIYLTNTVKGH